MTDPTNNALVARIKELEEALRPFAEATTFQMAENYILMRVNQDMIDIARKALNK